MQIGNERNSIHHAKLLEGGSTPPHGGLTSIPTKYKTQQETLERQLSAYLGAERTYPQQGVQILALVNKAYDLYLQ